MKTTKTVVTYTEMKEIERLAAEGGLSYYQMMENAGTAASKYILNKQPLEGKRALIFCGKGNNGGDGFVVARKLFEEKIDTKVILVDGEPKTQDAMKNKEICDALNVPILDINTLQMEQREQDKDQDDHQDEVKQENLDLLIEEADIIVDAIYGTGFHGALNEVVRKVTKRINSSNATTIALDIPSGLNGDSGNADRDTICADDTIAFHSYKPAHVMDKARRYCGQIICVDIGIK